MRAAAFGILLLAQATLASAQLSGGSYWEQVGLRAPGGMRLVSGGTLSGTPAATIAASLALPLSAFVLGLHAGALHDEHGVTSAGATVSALLRARGTELALRVGAAAAPDAQRGPSVTTLGAALSRSGWSVSVRSNILPATAAQSRDSVFVERDTTFRISYIEAGQPRRMYTDAEIGYRGAYARVAFEAAVGHRMGADREQPYWARFGATYRLTSVFAVGGTYGRDAGTPWLQSGPRTAGRLFVRIDPPQRISPERKRGGGNHPPPLRITTNGVTTFTIVAPTAASVEIAGTFTDWQPLALRRDANGSWSQSVSLERGVYQIALRIDDGAWQAPPGIALVPDEFGGQSGVFEVR